MTHNLGLAAVFLMLLSSIAEVWVGIGMVPFEWQLPAIIALVGASLAWLCLLRASREV